jgi:anti-sigma-K factor RskA
VDIKEYIQSGIVESYVMGLADPDEKAFMENAMQQYPEVREAVEAFELLLEKQAIDHSVAPPSFLKDRIKEKLFTNEDIENKAPSLAPKQFIKWKYRFIAAASLLAGSLLLNYFLYRNSQYFKEQYYALIGERQLIATNVSNLNNKINTLEESLSLLKTPGLKQIHLTGVKGQEQSAAVVYWKPASGEVYLLPSALSPLDEGLDYQLWAIVDGKPVDAGVIGNCESVCAMKTIPKAQTFAITVEEKGGKSTPNLEQLRVMGEV